jgi:hypothetical protein
VDIGEVTVAFLSLAAVVAMVVIIIIIIIPLVVVTAVNPLRLAMPKALERCSHVPLHNPILNYSLDWA